MQTRGAADGLTLLLGTLILRSYASQRRTVALRGSPMLLDFGLSRLDFGPSWLSLESRVR